METLDLLGAALGLGTLAGLNLYLTVFVTGLAIQQGWITLLPPYEHLAVLGDPLIVGVAGVLFALEFFADKVPWIDSLWDAVHTVIRPIGGAMLAITVLGETHPVYDVLVGLLAGGMALATHGAKAGTRLVANASPEPFSNVGLSLTEDALVIGGLALIYHYPVVALGLALVLFGIILWFGPRLFLRARTTMWFFWRRFACLSGASGEIALPPNLEMLLARNPPGGVRLGWASPCVTGPGSALKRNRFGWLLLTESDGVPALSFAERVNGEPRLTSIPAGNRRALHRAGFFRDRVVIYDANGADAQTFQFDCTRRARAQELVRRLAGEAAVPA